MHTFFLLVIDSFFPKVFTKHLAKDEGVLYSHVPYSPEASGRQDFCGRTPAAAVRIQRLRLQICSEPQPHLLLPLCTTTHFKNSQTTFKAWRTNAASSWTCNSPQLHPSLSALKHSLTSVNSQVRPPQMQRNEPHHQGERSRICATVSGQGRREWAVHGREPSLCVVRLRARHGRGRRLRKPAGAEGWVFEGGVECESVENWGGGEVGVCCGRSLCTDWVYSQVQ